MKSCNVRLAQPVFAALAAAVLGMFATTSANVLAADEPTAAPADTAKATAATPAPSSTVEQPLPIMPGAKVVTLWPAGHATLKNLDQKEVFETSSNKPQEVNSITNVNNPSIEVHSAPPDKANGCAIVVAPGGGNTKLVVSTEGREIVPWLNDLGISVFILRYRLRPYTSDGDAMSDTLRAIRTVRANAKEWNVDPKRIGIMGFSAGGEQAAYAALKFDNGNPDATDAIDKQSSRPDFAVLVYPGWRKMDLSSVPKDTPPVFLVSAGLDDASHAKPTVEVYNALLASKIPGAELHIYSRGGHGNGIRPRNGIPFGAWPQRFTEWASDLKLMKQQ